MRPLSDREWWTNWGGPLVASLWVAILGAFLALLVATEAPWFVSLPLMWGLGFASYPVWMISQE